MDPSDATIEELPEDTSAEAPAGTPGVEPAAETGTGAVEKAEPSVEPVPGPAVEQAPARRRLAKSPLLVYAGGWVGLSAVTVVLLEGRGYPPEVPEYRWLVLAALTLTSFVPAVWGVVWLLSRRTSPVREGVATSALLWSAVTAFLGVVLWWGALTLVDALRLGWLR